MASVDGYIGKQIGNYHIVTRLASGSFGSVYLAQHVSLPKQTVAIKLLHNEYLRSPELYEQFLQEAQLLDSLRHPHILPLIAAGIDEGFPYLMVEYAPRGSLREYIEQHAPHPLPLGKAITIVSQVAQALHYAHQQDIVHRDLKPDNILFNTNDEALIADFGVATILTPASRKQVQAIGTPAYMAPEQFTGTVGKKGDQYALGCIAYELVTGRQPFMAPDFISFSFQHMTEDPLPPRQLNPEVSVPIEDAILKAMAKLRAERHADVSAFATAFQSSPL